MSSSRVANFIIGGTEKAGTTSVYTYLAAHPEVCGSANKETDFFREKFTGDLSVDRENYASCFPLCQGSTPIVMEASPGYLGEAEIVVPRLSSLVPDVKLLFILRDPIERLYSSFKFHQGKLDLPDDMTFEDYVGKCMAFDSGDKSAADLGVGEWFLKTLAFGKYADYLQRYYECFPDAHIKVMFFEQLKEDVEGFMREVSEYIGIDSGYWDGFEFRKENVTFSGKNKALHAIAMRINAVMEPQLRRRPGLKRTLLGVYKKINQAREGYEPMPEPVRRDLEQYYQPCNESLATLLGDARAPWQAGI